MERFLFFKDAADDVYCNSASNLLSISMASDDNVTLKFKARSNDAAVDSVSLTVANETELGVMESIANAINYSTKAMIVVYDAVLGVGVHSSITASAITLDDLDD